MTIKSKSEMREIVIDLTGPDGNGFVLVGKAMNLAKQLSYSTEKKDKLRKSLTAGDYENLVKVFDEHFGEYITLLR